MAKKKTSSWKEFTNMIWAIVIAGGIGFYFSYLNVNIHVWGTLLGIWILVVLYEVYDLKKQIKK